MFQRMLATYRHMTKRTPTRGNWVRLAALALEERATPAVYEGFAPPPQIVVVAPAEPNETLVRTDLFGVGNGESYAQAEEWNESLVEEETRPTNERRDTGTPQPEPADNDADPAPEDPESPAA